MFGFFLFLLVERVLTVIGILDQLFK